MNIVGRALTALLLGVGSAALAASAIVLGSMVLADPSMRTGNPLLPILALTGVAVIFASPIWASFLLVTLPFVTGWGRTRAAMAPVSYYLGMAAAGSGVMAIAIALLNLFSATNTRMLTPQRDAGIAWLFVAGAAVGGGIIAAWWRSLVILPLWRFERSGHG